MGRHKTIDNVHKRLNLKSKQVEIPEESKAIHKVRLNSAVTHNQEENKVQEDRNIKSSFILTQEHIGKVKQELSRGGHVLPSQYTEVAVTHDDRVERIRKKGAEIMRLLAGD